MADHEHEKVADPLPTTDSSVNYADIENRKFFKISKFTYEISIMLILNNSEVFSNQFFAYFYSPT